MFKILKNVCFFQNCSGISKNVLVFTKIILNVFVQKISHFLENVSVLKVVDVFIFSEVSKTVPVFKNCSCFHFSEVSKNVPVLKIVHKFLKNRVWKFCSGISKYVHLSKFCFEICKHVLV